MAHLSYLTKTGRTMLIKSKEDKDGFCVADCNGEQMILPCRIDDILKWRTSGSVVQKALPFLTPEQREFLMTGFSLKEQQALFDDK